MGPTQRSAIAMYGKEHSHPAWSISPLTATSKLAIAQAVHANPTVTYRQLVTGKGMPGRSPSKGSMVREDPAFANVDLVSKHMRRVKQAMGHQFAGSALTVQVEEAARQLGVGQYVLTDLKLLRGPTPLVICATDMQLYFTCSTTHFLTQMVDFTFSEVLGSMDCWDNHAYDDDHGITLCMWRCYAQSKSAAATEFYLHHLRRECQLYAVSSWCGARVSPAR